MSVRLSTASELGSVRLAYCRLAVILYDCNRTKLGLWLRLECSLDCIIYVSEGFDVPRDYRSRRGRETIKRYDVTETYSHVVRQNLSETSITCAESG